MMNNYSYKFICLIFKLDNNIFNINVIPSNTYNMYKNFTNYYELCYDGNIKVYQYGKYIIDNTYKLVDNNKSEIENANNIKNYYLAFLYRPTTKLIYYDKHNNDVDINISIDNKTNYITADSENDIIKTLDIFKSLDNYNDICVDYYKLN